MIDKTRLKEQFAGYIDDDAKFAELCALYDTLSKLLGTYEFPAHAVGLGLNSMTGAQRAEPGLIIHIAAAEDAKSVFNHPLFRGISPPLSVKVTGPIATQGQMLLEKPQPDVLGSGQSPFDNAYEKPPGGVSIGVQDINPGTGTLGFFAAAASKTYLISCRHVLDMAYTGHVGALIQQQSAEDGNATGRHIATTSYIGEIGNDPDKNIDAGAALLETPSHYNAGQLQPNGSVKAITANAVLPTSNAAVHKSGRTTGLTNGKVETAEMTVTYQWAPSGPQRSFKCFSVVGDVAAFSRGGDSGSLILDKDENPMGMLFAGATDGSVTYAFNMKQVLAGLQAQAGEEFTLLST